MGVSVTSTTFINKQDDRWKPTTWTSNALPLVAGQYDVCDANGMVFVFPYGDRQNYMYSWDGFQYYTSTFPASRSHTNVVYAYGYYWCFSYASSNGYYWRSTDGITWTQGTASGSNLSGGCKVLFAFNKIIGNAGPTVRYSSNGTSFSSASTPDSQLGGGFCHTDSSYIIKTGINMGEHIYTPSSNDSVWVDRGTCSEQIGNAPTGETGPYILNEGILVDGIAFFDALYNGANSPHCLVSSRNGVNWDVFYTYYPPEGYDISTLAYAGGVFIRGLSDGKEYDLNEQCPLCCTYSYEGDIWHDITPETSDDVFYFENLCDDGYSFNPDFYYFNRYFMTFCLGQVTHVHAPLSFRTIWD